MRAALSQERLDLSQVGQDLRSFEGGLPVVVRGSTRDPLEHHVSRGTEQDDSVEPVVELRLVSGTSANEERATVVRIEQRGHLLFDPVKLAAVQLVDGLGVRPMFAPTL